MGHPKSEAIVVNRGELAAAFQKWDAETDRSGDPSPEAKADYFFGLLQQGKGKG